LRLGLVVTSETVDTRLDENETELGVYQPESKLVSVE